ncbi:hypothetical protein COL154_013919, partial [Colletotrichum chrysophilum]
HTDAEGTVVAQTNAGRAILSRSVYDSYGATQDHGNDDGPGYTGHVQDSLTGLTYMQQRYYDPGLMRFVSADPVDVDAATGGNFNRYWYAKDNPYRYTDPDGRCPTKDKPCPPPKPKPKPKPQPKPITLPTITVTAPAPAIPASPGFPSVQIPWPTIGRLAGAMARRVPYFLIFVPGNLAPSDCGDGRCAMMSELGENAPTDAPPGTLPLDKAKGKFGLSKDDVHKIKDNATGGLGGGRTWVGVDPNGEVGTSDNGKWVPQGTVDELKH